MNLITIHILAVVVLTGGVLARAQGTFQNLNFELANPGALTQNPFEAPYALHVPVANALPHWSVFYGNVQQSTINVNAPSLGSTAVSLVAPGGYGIIDGNYTVLLQGGVVEGFGTATPEPASISQFGLIPAGTQSLLFEGNGYQELDVLIGGQSVSFNAVGSGPNYTLYGANISAFAGLFEPLTFSAPSSGGLNDWLIDDITFSTTSAMPEPGIGALSAIGGLLFGARKWFARRS